MSQRALYGVEVTVATIRGRAFHLPADIQQMPEAAARHGRTLLPARTYDEGFPLLWPKCGGEIPIIAFLAEASTVGYVTSYTPRYVIEMQD
jgi:hypothetical protein